MTSHPTIQLLRSQISDFRLQISDLLEREAQLRKHVLPLLRARYETEIGIHEFKLLKIRIEVLELKFRIEHLLAIFNNGNDPLPDHLAMLDLEIQEVREHWQQEIKNKKRLLHASFSFLKTMTVLTQDESDRLKQLYQKMCLILHPDLNGESETFVLFWECVQEAYANGEINRLEALLVAVQTHERTPPQETSQETVAETADLRDERDRLESLVLARLQRLREIGQNPPFNMEHDLNNPQWIKMKQAEIKESTQAMTVRRDELRDVYHDIVENNNLKLH